MNPKQIVFLLFCGIVLVVSAMTIKHFSSANQLFSDAYQPVVEAHQRRQNTQNKSSEKDSSYRGIKESELYKAQGDRYSTY